MTLRRRVRSRLFAPALAGAAFLAAVATASAASVTVHVGSFYFEDASVGDGTVTARVGDQLRFVFDDSGAAGKRHSAEVVELGIYSGPQPVGATWVSPVLTTPGSFPLICRFHKAAPNNHVTTLVVTGTSVTPKPTPAPTPAPTPHPTQTVAPTPGGGSGGPSPTTGGGSQPSGSVIPSPGGAGPSALPEASGASPSPDPAPGSPGVSPAPSDPAGELPTGGSGPGPTTWFRSAWVAILAIVPIGAAALFAGLVAARRRA